MPWYRYVYLSPVDAHLSQQAEDHLNIFLEYMDGGSLRARLQTEGRMSEEQTAETTRKMLLGLRYLHSQGITHRDIKVGFRQNDRPA